MFRHTFNILDLARAEACNGTLMLRPRNACGSDSTLDVDDGSSHGGTTLTGGETLGSHGVSRILSIVNACNEKSRSCVDISTKSHRSKRAGLTYSV